MPPPQESAATATATNHAAFPIPLQPQMQAVVDVAPRIADLASSARTWYVFDVGSVGMQSVWGEEADEVEKIQPSRDLRLLVV